ncbi:hypothetical protein BASA61_003876 [Batrachochytrium salamandrivorans]|nr:hypothetical protein BASA61_003876 [Batrachochytrium salamandrivorans]
MRYEPVQVCKSYPVLARDFSIRHCVCWGMSCTTNPVKSLENSLDIPNIPPETLQTLLNLAEFMEHDDKALPIDIRTLGYMLPNVHAYAKALHYKELEFISEPSPLIEALISINNQLHSQIQP